jgi:hypothetical protein
MINHDYSVSYIFSYVISCNFQGPRFGMVTPSYTQDMLVSNDARREHYSVRCLTYLEVLSLRYPAPRQGLGMDLFGNINYNHEY